MERLGDFPIHTTLYTISKFSLKRKSCAQVLGPLKVDYKILIKVRHTHFAERPSLNYNSLRMAIKQYKMPI